VGIERSQQGSYLVLELRGDFRGGTDDYAELRRRGQEALAESPFLALDCTHVTFLDSQTLGLLVEMLRFAQGRGGNMLLFNVGERASRWLELSGLEHIFQVLPEGRTPGDAEAVAPPEERRGVIEAVDIERMVSELEQALGAADENGAPSGAPGPETERVLTEIDRLLKALGAEKD
jgi:anti-anti-sigma factor